MANEVKDICSGGVAAAIATVFTNPFDVIKTRLQVQGELMRKGQLTTLTYDASNPLRALGTVIRNDGLAGAQKGLLVAMNYGFVMNGGRLGLFAIAERNHFTRSKNGDVYLSLIHI